MDTKFNVALSGSAPSVTLDAFFTAFNSAWKNGDGMNRLATGTDVAQAQIALDGTSQSFAIQTNSVYSETSNFFNSERVVAVTLAAGSDVVISADTNVLRGVFTVAQDYSISSVQYGTKTGVGSALMNNFGSYLNGYGTQLAKYSGLINLETYSEKNDYIRLTNSTDKAVTYLFNFDDAGVKAADYYNNYVSNAPVTLNVYSASDLAAGGVNLSKIYYDPANGPAPTVDQHAIELNQVKVLVEAEQMENTDVYTLKLDKATDVMMKLDGTTAADGSWHAAKYVVRDSSGAVLDVQGLGNAMNQSGEAANNTNMFFKNYQWFQNLAAGTYTITVTPQTELHSGVPSVGVAKLSVWEFPQLPEVKNVDKTQAALEAIKLLHSDATELAVSLDKGLNVTASLNSFERDAYEIHVTEAGTYRFFADTEIGVRAKMQILDAAGKEIAVVNGYRGVAGDAGIVTDLQAGSYKVIVSELNDRAGDFRGQKVMTYQAIEGTGSSLPTATQRIGKSVTYENTGAYKLAVENVTNEFVSEVGMDSGANFITGFGRVNIHDNVDTFAFNLDKKTIVNFSAAALSAVDNTQLAGSASPVDLGLKVYKLSNTGEWNQVNHNQMSVKQGVYQESGFMSLEAGQYRAEFVSENSVDDGTFHVNALTLDKGAAYRAFDSLDGVLGLNTKVSGYIVGDGSIVPSPNLNSNGEAVYTYWQETGDVSNNRTWTDDTIPVNGSKGLTYSKAVANTHYQFELKEDTNIFVKFSEKSANNSLTNSVMALRSVDKVGEYIPDEARNLNDADGVITVFNGEGKTISLKAGVYDIGLFSPDMLRMQLGEEQVAYKDGLPFELMLAKASDVDASTGQFLPGKEVARDVISLTKAEAFGSTAWSKVVDNHADAGAADVWELVLEKAQTIDIALVGKSSGLVDKTVDVELKITDAAGRQVAGLYSNDVSETDASAALHNAHLSAGTYQVHVGSFQNLFATDYQLQVSHAVV